VPRPSAITNGDTTDGEESTVAIDSASIDRVLQAAVDDGDVPNVVAIAADRDGVIYRGAAGSRTAGGSDPSPPTPTSGSCR
jgi:hypothetical protein